MVQSTVDEGRQHALQVAAGLRNHLDTGRRDGHLQWPGDRAADQHIGPSLCQPGRTSLRLFHIEDHISARLLDAVVDLDDQHVSGHIEDRANPVLPVRYRDLHHIGANIKSRAKRNLLL